MGHAVFNGVVRKGLSEELTLGQRQAVGEGVSHASLQGMVCQVGAQQVQRPSEGSLSSKLEE